MGWEGQTVISRGQEWLVIGTDELVLKALALADGRESVLVPTDVVLMPMSDEQLAERTKTWSPEARAASAVARRGHMSEQIGGDVNSHGAKADRANEHATFLSKEFATVTQVGHSTFENTGEAVTTSNFTHPTFGMGALQTAAGGKDGGQRYNVMFQREGVFHASSWEGNLRSAWDSAVSKKGKYESTPRHGLWGTPLKRRRS